MRTNSDKILEKIQKHFSARVIISLSILHDSREKNKKWAEQGAALVFLCALDVIDKETLVKSGNLLGSDYQEMNRPDV